MDMSHEAYRFGAFDCDEPEDVLTQSIPHGCSVKALDGKPRDMEPELKQEYMILQRVVTFEYSATLCILCRSRFYYDCMWKSHIRITVPGSYAGPQMRSDGFIWDIQRPHDQDQTQFEY